MFHLASPPHSPPNQPELKAANYVLGLSGSAREQRPQQLISSSANAIIGLASHHRRAEASSTRRHLFALPPDSLVSSTSEPKVSIQLPVRALESFATCFITRNGNGNGNGDGDGEFRAPKTPDALPTMHASLTTHTQREGERERVLRKGRVSVLPMAFINCRQQTSAAAHPQSSRVESPLALINTCLLSQILKRSIDANNKLQAHA